MRYLGNDTNIVRDAVLTATNGVASDAIYRTDDAAKVGGGDVQLAGPYEGAADTTIDIEIVDNGGGTIQVSQPAFVGVGSGSMSAVAVAGIDPQTVTVTLEDLGTDTRFAYAPFQGVPLKAKAAGVDGNAISIDVDHSALVLTATDWALREDLQQDQNEYIGDHWDFGAVVLEPDGKIPLSAPRLCIGSGPQVVRQFKKYVNGRYVFSFNPPPAYDVPKGARVHSVTGTRTITITDGGAPETLPNIVTLYDALSAIRDLSDLVTVDGPIVNDRLLNGQGITELSVRTRSYVLGVTNSGGGAIEHAELTIAALDTAPTETLVFTCAENTLPGSEVWEVRGDVSGPLDRATTNVPYADGPYSALIPVAGIDPGGPTGLLLVELILVPRGEGQLIPSLCVDRPLLGLAAQNGVKEWVYTKRPPEECDCSIGDLEGGPSDECLGITATGGDVSEASQLIRLQRLTNAIRTFVGMNTSPQYSVAGADVDWVEESGAIFGKCLLQMSGGTLTFPTWVAAHNYPQDFVVGFGLYRYAATTPGVSDATIPSFNPTVGSTTADGAAVWTNLGKLPYGMYDDAFDDWKSEMAVLNGLGAPTNARPWAADVAVPAYSSFPRVRPTVRNGWTYSLNGWGGSAATGSSEPTWPTAQGAIVIDGGVQWYAYNNYWNASTVYALDHVIDAGTGVLYKVTTGGTAGATEPVWTTDGSTITDGTVVWSETSSSDLPATQFNGQPIDKAHYFERFKTQANDVLAAAGIFGNFDQAGLNGDGCWQDWKAAYWFAFDGPEPYLPIQQSHYYNASKLGADPNSNDGRQFAYSTHEFSFGPRFGCVDALIEGDRIRVTVIGVAGGSGYQQGDAFSIQVNQANPLPFGGGQTGDDTLTFSVMLSVDGRIQDYALVTTAPTPYAGTVSPSGAVAFQIAPGGIPFALRDQFQFTVEGGRFRWRRDGGAWESPVDIADTTLADGLSVSFAGGVAPSWVANDRWSFRAEATFGVSQLRTPVDGEFEWVGDTVIEITATDGAVVGILIANHTIPSDATITLQGSDDDFATSPLNQAITWRRGDIWQAVAADRAKYRVTIDRSGSARWIYLGASTLPTIRTGRSELGKLTKRVRLPSVTARTAIGATIDHTALPQSSVDAILSMLEHAGEFDDRLFAIVPNDAEPDCGLVRYTADSVEITDELGFQPRDVANRRQALSMQLEAAA